MPIVANVLTTIQMKDDLREAVGCVSVGFSCSIGKSPSLSTSSPISKSSGDFSLTKLSVVEACGSFSSYASASVMEELMEGARSVDRSAIIAERTG